MEYYQKSDARATEIHIYDEDFYTEGEPNTLNNKYKELKPEDTISNVKDFFKTLSHDFEIKERALFDTKAGLYSETAALMYKGKEVGTANGKGTSRIFSKASCYGELYERFCMLHIFKNPEYMEQIKIPEEKTVPISYLIDQYDVISEFERRKLFEDTFSYLYPNGIPGMRFDSLTDESHVFLNPYFMIHVSGSNGMAAGNTKEEALVQGISELFERHIGRKVYFGEDILTEISKDAVIKAAPETLEIFRTLNKKGYEIRIYDASFKTELPVIVGLTIDLENGKHYVNCGSNPVFNIALERVLTETFQGEKTDDGRSGKFVFNIPQNDRSLYRYQRYTINGSEITSMESFLNAERKGKVNNSIYLDEKRIDSDRLLAHLRMLSKRKGISLYYHDFSLSEKMAAVWCHSKELSILLANDMEELSVRAEAELKEIVSYVNTEKHSVTDAINLLESLYNCEICKSRVLFEVFYNVGIKKEMIEYLKYVLNIKICDYNQAASIDSDILDRISRTLPRVNELRTYTEYCRERISKAERDNTFKLFGIEKDLIRILDEKGNDYDRRYIYEVFNGEEVTGKKEWYLNLLKHIKKKCEEQ